MTHNIIRAPSPYTQPESGLSRGWIVLNETIKIMNVTQFYWKPVL